MSKKEEKMLKTVKVKGGGDYVMVNTRTLDFHDQYPNGKIETKIIDRNDQLVIMESIVTPDVANPERTFNGIACEVQGQGFVNDFSHIENCETSARGRALGGLGIGIKESMASFEEVANAKLQQSEKKTINGMKEIMSKFHHAFFWAEKWMPMAVKLNICKPDAFVSSFNKVFSSKTVKDAELVMTKINGALHKYHDELTAHPEYKKFVDKAKNESEVGDTKQANQEGNDT